VTAPTQSEYSTPRTHLLGVEIKPEVDGLSTVTIVVSGGEVLLAVETDMAVIVLAAAAAVAGVVVAVDTTFVFVFRKAVYLTLRQ
jgi:hypothetical protein